VREKDVVWDNCIGVGGRTRRIGQRRQQFSHLPAILCGEKVSASSTRDILVEKTQYLGNGVGTTTFPRMKRPRCQKRLAGVEAREHTGNHPMRTRDQLVGGCIIRQEPGPL